MGLASLGRLARVLDHRPGMDVARPDRTRRKRQRQIVLGALAAIAVLLVTLGLSRLEPAAPSVERATIWIDAVKRGEMLRQVRGPGSIEIERERLGMNGASTSAQLAVQRASVEQRAALAQLRRSQLEGLKVRAGMQGVLQQVPVEVRQRVAPGTNLARVAQPERLKAVLRIAETQARDVALGQKAEIDTRNGIVAGHVARIDPAAQAGTVTVDVVLDAALPKGARPDLTVDGTIELERLSNVLHVGRPAQGQVILSDTSTWDAHDRIRLH